MTEVAEAVYVQAASLGVSLAVFGAVLGIAQWALLRAQLHAIWWVPATCLGWALTGAITGALAGLTGGSVSSIGPKVGPLPGPLAAVVGLPVAFLPAAFQWLILRQQVARAIWWPLASVTGLIVGLVASAAVVRGAMVDIAHWLDPTDFPSAKSWLFVGLLTGIAYGTFTWLALRHVHRPSAPTT